MTHKKWWRGDIFANRLDNLRRRTAIINDIRHFFGDQDFDEVETPFLQNSPGMEAHVHPFSTQLLSARLEDMGQRYLHTSPEFAMKKLLVAGMQRIYQICKTYRNAEDSPLHACEFTMLEWYRAHTGYEGIMDDCEALLRHVARHAPSENKGCFHHKGMICDPSAPWQKITICEAFDQYAAIALTDYLDDLPGFADAARGLGLNPADNDRWDDIFFRIFMDKIEPKLGQGAPTILYEYPASMAALAGVKEDDPRFAKRFEIYVCGIELANAFDELTDPVEQRERFEDEMALKKSLYGYDWPVDEDFIAALEAGMPPSSGIALGIDRLVMLTCGVNQLSDIMWCG